MSRLLAMFPPFRWWRTLLALKHGARVHPQARLLGSRSQIVLGSGCKIGARVCIDPGRSGRVSIGERVWVAADVEMQTDSEIKIREGASIQRRSTINGSTVLGRDCILAPGVFISSGTHPFRAIPHLHIREQERLLSRKATERFALDRPIWVQDDCWLGTNVVVCPGVTIGKGSVVGANSVVTHDVAPYSVVAGCPARLIARRLEWVPPSSLNPARDLDHPYLLDARLRDDARGIFIEVNATDPLLAALSLPRENTRIQISWRATQHLAVIAGERKLSLPSGEGKLEIQAGDLNIAHNIALFALKLASDNPSGVCLDILGIQCI